MTKPIEFSRSKPWGPLVVIITRDSLDVSNDAVPGLAALPGNEFPPTYSGVMQFRKKYDLLVAANTPHNETITDEWKRRRKAGSSKEPHCVEDPDHIPIVVREGEQIEFRCTEPFPFSVWLGREPWVKNNFNPNQLGPDYAGDHSAEMFREVGVITIKMPNANGGPADQRFYKAHAFLHSSGGTISIDPDGICDR